MVDILWVDGIRIWFEANNPTGTIECKRTFAQIKDFENVVLLKNEQSEAGERFSRANANKRGRSVACLVSFPTWACLVSFPD